MATANPFDLLGDDDNDDPSQLIAKQQQKVIAKKADVAPPAPAKLPSKPLPPSQAVKEAKNNAAAGGPCGGGHGGGGRGRGGGRGLNRDSRSNGNVNGFSGGYGGGEDGEVKKSSERGRGGYGAPCQSFRGGRHGGFGGGEGGGDSEQHPHRQFERRSGTGRGYEMKREGAGHGNWGTPTDEVLTQEPEEIVNLDDNTVVPEKQAEQEDADANKETKESPVEVEKEPEAKEMTLDEYQKILEEKRKALLALKTEERKVDVDEEFGSMQQLSIKKGNDDIFIKLGSDKDSGKRKETADRDERVRKSLSINEFLKPIEGERSYGPGGQGRGRGRGDCGGSRSSFGGGNASTAAAPSIEDPGQFPTLGGK